MAGEEAIHLNPWNGPIRETSCRDLGPIYALVSPSLGEIFSFNSSPISAMLPRIPEAS